MKERAGRLREGPGKSSKIKDGREITISQLPKLLGEDSAVSSPVSGLACSGRQNKIPKER